MYIYRQHPETGMVQRVHTDGTHHLPSFDPRCADETCGRTNEVEDVMDLKIGDYVAWADEPTVLGRVADIAASGMVRVVWPNGDAEAEPEELVVISRRKQAP